MMQSLYLCDLYSIIICVCFILSLSVGDNVEDLFTRIASVSFERVMKNEIEATNSIQETTGQLAHNSSLISEYA